MEFAVKNMCCEPHNSYWVVSALHMGHVQWHSILVFSTSIAFGPYSWPHPVPLWAQNTRTHAGRQFSLVGLGRRPHTILSPRSQHNCINKPKF